MLKLKLQYFGHLMQELTICTGVSWNHLPNDWYLSHALKCAFEETQTETEKLGNMPQIAQLGSGLELRHWLHTLTQQLRDSVVWFPRWA